jgi:hypothetical protein
MERKKKQFLTKRKERRVDNFIPAVFIVRTFIFMMFIFVFQDILVLLPKPKESVSNISASIFL